MKHLTFLFIFLWSNGFLLGQFVVQGNVMDASTHLPIPYVNIGSPAAMIGTVSDDDGYFHLVSKVGLDTLLFSSVGYESAVMAVHNTREIDTIYLHPKTYDLQTIEISHKKFNNPIVLGARNKKGRGPSFGFGSHQLGAELGAAIRIEKETFIHRIHFVLNHAKGDSLLLRINIYNFSDGKLGKKISTQNIIYRHKQSKGVHTIDISEHQIIVYDDIIVSLEWLRDFTQMGNRSITFDTKKSKLLTGTYVRYASQGPMLKLPHKQSHKPCIYIEGVQAGS